jgi:hypothetical protein
MTTFIVNGAGTGNTVVLNVSSGVEALVNWILVNF